MHSILRENNLTLKLAFPIIASNLGQMLLGLSDTLMIGRVGTVELAAAAFLNILIHLALVIGIGLSVAVSVQVSHAHGRTCRVGAGEALRHGLALGLLLGALVWAGMAASLPLLRHAGQPAEVIAALPGYLRWVAASMAFMIPVMVMKSFAEAKDHPWPVFWIQLAGVLLNIGLNALLIFGHGGFPAMGLTGAGLATFLARAATLAGMAWYLRRSRTLADSRPDGWLRPLDLRELGALIKLALPITAQMLTEFGAFAFSALLIGRLGAVPMAAHQIALTCAATTFMLPMGLSGAVGIRVGHAMGAGHRDRCVRILQGAQGTTVIAMGLFAAVYLLLGPAIARAFTPDPELIGLTVALLSIAGFFQLFDGIQVVSVGALRALKDLRIPTLLSVLGYWAIAVPFGVWLGFGLERGVTGFWTGLASGLAIAAFTMTLRLVWVLKRSRRED